MKTAKELMPAFYATLVVQKSKLSNYQLNELCCLHGELLYLLDKYSHLKDTKKWQSMKKQVEKDFQKFNAQYDKQTER